MRQQSFQASCGPVALCNALEAIGVPSPGEEAAMKLANTSPVTGTTPGSLKKALERLGVLHHELKTKAAHIAACALIGAMTGGFAVILLVDGSDHWVSAIGALGSRILVADSADHGVVISLTLDQLLSRWGDDSEFYGIFVGKTCTQ